MIAWVIDGGWIIMVIVIGFILSLVGCWLTRKGRHSEFFGCDACEGSYDEDL